jgi:hypothetical protein
MPRSAVSPPPRQADGGCQPQLGGGTIHNLLPCRGSKTMDSATSRPSSASLSPAQKSDPVAGVKYSFSISFSRYAWAERASGRGTPLGQCGPAEVHHRSRRASEDVEVTASDSMQDESALASLDLAGLESLRSICSSIALTELAADFRMRRPTSVSSAWRIRWCCG